MAQRRYAPRTMLINTATRGPDHSNWQTLLIRLPDDRPCRFGYVEPRSYMEQSVLCLARPRWL